MRRLIFSFSSALLLSTRSLSAAAPAPTGDGERETTASSPQDSSDPKRAAVAHDDSGPRPVQNGLEGSTGLLHVVRAGSGAPGTLRVAMITSYFGAQSFLCSACEQADGTPAVGDERVRQLGTRWSVSLTPLPFLETYAALRYQTTANRLGEPEVIQIAGDGALGVKTFSPARAERIYSFGGDLRLHLLSGAGSVGFDTARFDVRGAASLDLTRSKTPVPVQADLNVGYRFDESGLIADRVERDRAAVLGTRQRITRIERFGHDLDRVDSLALGVGAQAPLRYVAPFAEWSLDVPMNRQGYVCHRASRTAGDDCLADHARLGAFPSRLTFGVQAFPAVSDFTRGLTALLALDVATGAKATFLEEVAPEAPWMLHFGLGYAIDAKPRVERVLTERTVQQVVEREPPPRLVVAGKVVDAKTGEPVAGVAVAPATGDGSTLLTSADGEFRIIEVAPGEVKLALTRDGYVTRDCSAFVDQPKTSQPGARTPAKASGASPASLGGPRTEVTEVRCELTALPNVAVLDGALRDAETTEFVAAATVRITDALGRSLTLTTDERGAFRVENIPPGKVSLRAEAAGYLPSVTELEVLARKDLRAALSIARTPKQPNVVVTKNELKLKRQIHFLHDSAEILPDSAALVDEIAETLRQHPEIRAIEIQGHTDDTGASEHNARLSDARAKAVRDALIRDGVEPERLQANGYGEDKPLVPNTTAANRTTNRRVQLMIVSP